MMGKPERAAKIVLAAGSVYLAVAVAVTAYRAGELHAQAKPATVDVQSVLDVIAEADDSITYTEDDPSFHCAVDGDHVCGADVQLALANNGGTYGVTAIYPDGDRVTVYSDGTRTYDPDTEARISECWSQYESGAYTAEELNICLADLTTDSEEN